MEGGSMMLGNGLTARQLGYIHTGTLTHTLTHTGPSPFVLFRHA